MNNLAAVQTAIYAALTAAPGTYPVYDAVPQSAARPYIVIAALDALPDDELAAATTDATVHIDTWSEYAGKSQTHTMLQFVRARLDGQTISGAWACTEDWTEIMEDVNSTASARLYRGMARYRVRVG